MQDRETATQTAPEAPALAPYQLTDNLVATHGQIFLTGTRLWYACL